MDEPEPVVRAATVLLKDLRIWLYIVVAQGAVNSVALTAIMWRG